MGSHARAQSMLRKPQAQRSGAGNDEHHLYPVRARGVHSRPAWSRAQHGLAHRSGIAGLVQNVDGNGVSGLLLCADVSGGADVAHRSTSAVRLAVRVISAFSSCDTGQERSASAARRANSASSRPGTSPEHDRSARGMEKPSSP